jgi:hypothetical protein
MNLIKTTLAAVLAATALAAPLAQAQEATIRKNLG